MRIVLVNPNTTASMTEKAARAARAAASPGTEIVARNPAEGLPSIEGFYDGALAVPGMLGEIAASQDADGFVLSCFDDTGLDAARCLVEGPVVGIGEAAFHAASLIARRFSVVTTLGRSVSGIEANLASYGLAARCGRVRASEVPVLALEDPRSDARARISAEIEAAIREDAAEAIVLGCAGMADLAADLTARHGLPVIEGVGVAVKLVEALVGLGLRTSKVRSYAAPRDKRAATGNG